MQKTQTVYATQIVRRLIVAVLAIVFIGLSYALSRKIIIADTHLQIGRKKILWENILSVQDRKTKVHYRVAHVIPVGAYNINDLIVYF
jgi:hypothetical protein